MAPTTPPRSEIARRTIPTVAEMIAQPMICGNRAIAMRNPSLTVGSPPCRRMLAAPMSAALQKMTTV